jgi:glycine dehydrogenase subunit 2
MTTIFDRSSPGRNRRNRYPDTGEALAIPSSWLREDSIMPDVSEQEAVRHYTHLSTMNFGVDTGMYPLGSCTMKYNPKINERLASHPNFTGLHPMSGEKESQGALRVMFELEDMLCTLTGMDGYSLQPAAGAQGELAAVIIMKTYFQEKGEGRDIILIPDSAHGTNPASVAMCGYTVKTVPSTEDGDVDLEALKSMLDARVAGMMLTSPNTLGLFDRSILEIARLLHDNGSLFYGDGANFNAVAGRVRLSDMGFDLVHLNLHKTFSTPHGGGGPGSGPVGVTDELTPYLPAPRVVQNGNTYSLQPGTVKSIGRLHSYHGNFLILLRAWVYLTMLGSSIREVSDAAVLNANYLLHHLRKVYNLPVDRTCMHEFVLNDKGLPGEVTTNDIAKRLLDYGFHAPTVYFPLIINGAMMIEPTESEGIESLKRFIQAMEAIRDEAEKDPEKVRSAPHATPVSRVDAVTAARKPILRWDAE